MTKLCCCCCFSLSVKLYCSFVTKELLLNNPKYAFWEERIVSYWNLFFVGWIKVKHRSVYCLYMSNSRLLSSWTVRLTYHWLMKLLERWALTSYFITNKHNEMILRLKKATVDCKAELQLTSVETRQILLLWSLLLHKWEMSYTWLSYTETPQIQIYTQL